MNSQNRTDKGSIRISEEVVAIIAGIAATNVEGVAGMSGGIAGGIAQLLGRNSLAKGVKVSINQGEAVIDIFVIVNFGVRIPVTAFNIQEKVKNSVESLTNICVKEANVHVQGVIAEKEESEIAEKNTPTSEV